MFGHKKDGIMRNSGIFVFVCLLLGALQVQCMESEETYRDMTLVCDDDWWIWKTNCYKYENFPLPYMEASLACLRQGAYLYYTDNEAEYWNFVGKEWPQKIWFGYISENETFSGSDTPLDLIAGWGYNQPDFDAGTTIAVSRDEQLTVHDGAMSLPFVCKRRACRKDYKSCDLGSQCLPMSKFCNGLPDCTDGSDENNCPDYDTRYIKTDEDMGEFYTGTIPTGTTSRTWTIEVPIGRRIQLNFRSFTIEENVGYITVRSGTPDIAFADEIARLTGSVPTQEIFSINNYLIVSLTAHDLPRSIPSIRFTWSTNIPSIPLEPPTLTSSDSLGSLLIPFSSYDKPPKDLFLQWTITSAEETLITYYIEVRQHSGYKADDVEYDIRVNGENVENHNYYMSSSNIIHVQSMFVPKYGQVTLRYKTGCDINVSEQYGTVHSPKPVIPNNLTCNWSFGYGFTVGRPMSIRFKDLNLNIDPRSNFVVQSEDIFQITSMGGSDFVIEEDVSEYESAEDIIGIESGNFKVTFKSDEALMSGPFSFMFATDCEPLELSEFTVLSTNASYFEENVGLSCPTGYQFNLERYMNDSSISVTCGADGWYVTDDHSTCIPECQIKYCGIPYKIENGGVTEIKGVVYGSEATYECNPGFSPDTDGLATCEADGQWHNVPTCSSFDCDALDETTIIENGSFNILAGDMSGEFAAYDTVVEFYCNDGYELYDGPVISNCNQGGWTHGDHPPSCQRVVCPLYPIDHSNMAEPSVVGFVVYFGDRLTVECDAGYQFVGLETSTTKIECMGNRQFNDNNTLQCENIDECSIGSSCDTDTTSCRDLDGGYRCDCLNGYARFDDFTCEVIDPCPAGCSDECVSSNVLYNCTCPDGNVLYESDGFQGFPLPERETGNLKGDVYYIDHTCVPLQCGPLENVPYGMYLDKRLKNYHFGDSVKLRCDDNYEVEGESEGTLEVQVHCNASGQWDQLYSCVARTCDLPNSGTLAFGSKYNLGCTKSYGKEVVYTSQCILQSGSMALYGENIDSCPEIECGNPMDSPVWPLGGAYKDGLSPQTTYFNGTGSNFEFTCGPGYTVSGLSGGSNYVVECTADGYWNMGTLACIGVKCPDPGTPGDAVLHTENFEVEAVLYYQCNKPGFEIDGPANYTCEYDEATNNATWSDSLGPNSLPTCQDVEPPMITSNDCNTTKTYDRLRPIEFDVPVASDNFAIKSFDKSSFLNTGDIINSNESLTYTVTDFAGNTATCTMDFVIIDRSLKPNFDCPIGDTLVIIDGVTDPTYSDTDIPVTEGHIISADVRSRSNSWTLNDSTDLSLLNVNSIGNSFLITLVAENDHGTKSYCSFVRNYLAGACFEQELFEDINADRVCSSTDTGMICESTCNNGYVYSDGSNSKNFSCTGAGTWDTTDAPKDRFCLRTKYPKYDVEMNVVYRFGTFNSLCYGDFFSLISANRQNVVENIQNACSEIGWGVTVNTVGRGPSTTMFNVDYLLTIMESSTSPSACIQLISNLSKNIFNVSGDQLTCNNVVNSLVPDSIETTSSVLTCTDDGYTAITRMADDVSVCIPWGPGSYFNGSTTLECPEGLYQDEFGQTNCKVCRPNFYPIPDKTSCLETCLPGSTSDTGFMPCSACPEDTYWVDKTTCEPCPGDSSTAGRVASLTCYSQCGPDTYSDTGYDVDVDGGCQECPFSFEQPNAGQTSCNRITTNATIEECDVKDCSGHGTCVTEYGRAICDCETSYYGPNCENQYHICNGNPCNNDGTCVPGSDQESFTCTCNTEYDECSMVHNSTTIEVLDVASKTISMRTDSSLAECEQLCVNEDGCVQANYIIIISNNARACFLFNSSIDENEKTPVSEDKESVFMTKECVYGFDGDNCENDIKNECDGAGCHADSLCVDRVGGFDCFCPVSGGYTGTLCDVSRDPCSPNPCAHGQCTAYGAVSYTCECDDGYIGYNCDVDEDYCSIHPNLCVYGGECVDRAPGMNPPFVCQCPSGFTGNHCEIPPNFCADVDCEGNNVGYNSIDIMNCSCECGLHFLPDGNRCLRNKYPCDDDPCVNGNCTNINDDMNFMCTCEDGYTGSKCQHEIDECLSSPCLNGGDCSDEIAGYSCSCTVGYNGTNCEIDLDFCNDDDCSENSECVELSNGYECRCNDGYMGQFCESEIDECSSFPCEHNGNCTDAVNDYSCSCPEGWTGKNCQTSIDRCDEINCLNEGRCYNLPDRPFCRCEGGALGDTCENALKLCDIMKDIKPCANGGMCFDTDRYAECQCTASHNVEQCFFNEPEAGYDGGINYYDSSSITSSFTSDDCKDACLTNPSCDAFTIVSAGTVRMCFFYNMSSLAVVEDSLETKLYKRICPIDYVGSSCEVVKDWCEESPCENDGECVCKDPTGYKCICKPGYYGVNCQYRDDPCDTAPCNGVVNAHCISDANEYVCQCDGGRTWTGSYCKDTDPNYILLVNSYHSQDIPETKTPYAVSSDNTLSVMMKFRIHACNTGNRLRSLLTVSISDAIKPALEDSFLLVITDRGISSYNGSENTNFTFNDDFGSQITDGEWHTLGISLNPEMSVTLDAVTYTETLPTTFLLEPNIQYNAMNYLGFGCITEFRDVTVWNVLLTSSDFTLAHSNEFSTNESPIQGWQNYVLSPFTTVLEETLTELVSGEPSAPSLDCSDVEDMYFVPTDRLTTLEDIPDFSQQYTAVKNSNDNLEYQHSLPDVMINDYYPVIIWGMDRTTKQYSECRSFLYVRYNEVCSKDVHELVAYGNCSNGLGICDATCKDPDLYIPAPLPHIIQCTSLGVWDIEQPYSNMPIPQCVEPVDVQYFLTAFLQFEVAISCDLVFTEVNYQNLVDKIHTDLVLLNTKWAQICDENANGEICDNLDVTGSGCNTDRDKAFDMVLSLKYPSSTIFAIDAVDEMPIVDAFNIIILIENEFDISNFGQAKLVRESVDVSLEVNCPSGHFMRNDVCLPCSPGWYKDDTMMMCKPCEYGSYQPLEGQTSCTACSGGTTTNIMGATTGDSCKEECAMGYEYVSELNECNPCPRHYYQNEAGKHYCLPCDIGKKTALNGSTSADDCKADCNAGFERDPDTEKCVECERGFWRNLNYDDCQLCPVNTTTFETASVNVEACSMDICDPGQFFDEESTRCQDCSIGYYQDELYVTECKPCASNKTTYDTGASLDSQCIFYCTDGYEVGDEPETCEPCERGTYKTNDGDMMFDLCQSCPAGKTTNDEASISDASCSLPICGQGEVIIGEDCELCPAGTYSDVQLPDLDTACQNCLDGYWTREDGSNSSQCERYCDHGSYLVGDICIPCPRGTYKDYFFDVCTMCDFEQTTEEEGAKTSQECSIPTCSPGNVIVDGQCSPCPVDTYSDVDMPDSSVECQQCGECDLCQDQGTLDVGANNISLCLPICEAGYYYDLDNEECEYCPIGFYKTADDRFATRCTPCEDERPGYVTEDIGATSVDACTLRNCSTGQKIVNDNCEECPVGSYQNETRQNFCYDCGPNLSTDGLGKSSSDDCQTDCGRGLHGTLECKPCKEGYFKNTTGYADCEKCPEDTTSNDKRTECNIVLCHYGKEYISATDSCVECNVGFYKFSLGNVEKCTACLAGTTTDGPGQTNCTKPFCVAGKYLDMNEVCMPCPVGSYKSSAGNEPCDPCPTGYTTAGVASLSKELCNIVVCPAGQYRKENETSFCYDCDFDTYQPDSGQLECLPCLNDKITMAKESTSEDECVVKCSAGYRFNSNTQICEVCPAGTYKQNDGNFEDCTECPSDKTTVGTGKTSSADCSRDLCQPGTFFVVSGSTASCDPCSIGTFSDSLNVDECTSCPPGNTTRYMRTDDSDFCIDDCAIGFGYSSVTRECYQCPTSLFNDKKGTNPTMCKKCPAGTTNTKAGSDDCNFQDDNPRVVNAVDASVEMVFDIEIDSCSVSQAIDINIEAIDDRIRNLFIGFTTSRFNGEYKLCTDPECLNINSALVGCVDDREITLEIVFKQISDFVTDTSDGDLDLQTLEVIAEILTLYSDRLNDQGKAIVFKEFKSAKFIDICSPGEERVNDECVSCEEGYYGIDGLTCVPCALNTYQSVQGEPSCVSCPDRHYTESTNSTSLDDCIETCDAGFRFISDTKTCQKCDVGTYKTSSGNDEGCTSCPAGKTTITIGSTSLEDCSQNECVAGEYYERKANNVVECHPCPVGKYSNAIMAPECTPCAQGTTLQVASTLITQCVDDCAAGSGYVVSPGSTGSCQPCKLNYYNDKTGRHPNKCKQCPPNEFTQSSGQDSCDPDPKGEVRPLKYITIKIVVKYEVAIDSCSDTVTLSRLRTSISFKIRSQLSVKSEKFNNGRSFCSAECANVNVDFVVNTNTVKNCIAKSATRRKRALTHELALSVEINNVTETVTDVNEELPTEEVVSQILAYDDFSVNDNLVYAGSEDPQVTPVCAAGEQVATNGIDCEPCPVGYYSNSHTTCEKCPVDTYQNVTGQTSCVDCPSMTLNDDLGSTSSGSCRGYCTLNPGHCNNRGTCYETGRRSASCTCNDGFEGVRCESRSDPTSNLGVILGAAIGGGGGLLIIIIIIIGCWRHMSSQDEKKPKLPMYDTEYYNTATYDNAGFYPVQRGLPTQPAIGYPSFGYHPDTSFEAGSPMDPYRFERPSIHPDDQDDQPQYVWRA